jgi:hypothetical protein
VEEAAKMKKFIILALLALIAANYAYPMKSFAKSSSSDGADQVKQPEPLPYTEH